MMPGDGPPGRTSTSTAGFVARWSFISLRGDGTGDQPWDRTTFSRASAERYDHTSSLVEETRSGSRGCHWSGREDSNLHGPAPEAGGLPITRRPDDENLG